jgi:hypothetical protein
LSGDGDAGARGGNARNGRKIGGREERNRRRCAAVRETLTHRLREIVRHRRRIFVVRMLMRRGVFRGPLGRRVDARRMARVPRRMHRARMQRRGLRDEKREPGRLQESEYTTHCGEV